MNERRIILSKAKNAEQANVLHFRDAKASTGINANVPHDLRDIAMIALCLRRAPSWIRRQPSRLP